MRTRKIFVGLALGTALALGAIAAPAQATPAASATASDTASPADTRGAAAVEHFYSSHSTERACGETAAYWIGLHPTWNAVCRQFPGTDGVMKWHLYMIY